MYTNWPIAERLESSRHLVDDLALELRTDGSDVVVEETATSWILLGHEVYKIKKPVKLPFLDFGSLAKRERACRAELRVNRRLAPRTYLGVTPIRRALGGRATLRGRGPVVEWAVRMVRRDAALRADVLLDRGALGVEAIDRLASSLAAFHADSATNERIAAWGAAGVVLGRVADNAAALRGTGERFVRAEELLEIERRQIAFVRGHEVLFEDRMRGGHIRDGHGDLRLEHVFFTPDGDFEIIDGIEFDPAYRHGDVCADVAFFAMDLARLGRVDYAERFLARYARASNDFDLYALVDFYETYRASVRAKISALVALDPSTPDDLRRRAEADARRYLLLALSSGRRSVVPPSVVVVGGGIASGKSTIAERLAGDLGAAIVDADRTRKHIIGLAPTEHADDAAWNGAYAPRVSDRVYAELIRRAEVVLASGRPVVLDASFRTAAERQLARALADRHGVPFRFFECVAPAAVSRERIAHRDRATSVSDARLDVHDAFLAAYEPVEELPPTQHFVMDTTKPLDATIADVESIIATWPRGLVA